MIHGLHTTACLTRARTFLGLPSTYVLGAGGRDPMTPTPFTWRDGRRGADCIGFALWCRGIDRYQPGKFSYYDGWMNTDSILEDARHKVGGGHWRLLDRPTPGCLVIYPSLYRKGKITRMGHVGVVTAVPAEWRPRSLCTAKEWLAQMKLVEVIDCAGAIWRKLRGRAIARRDASIWAKDGHFVDVVL